METGKMDTHIIAELFLHALATPKSNLTKEYLSGGMSDPCSIIDPNERRE